jgi:hypothetical protein
VAACLPAAAARLDGCADLATGKLSSKVVEQLLFFYLPALSSVQTTQVHPPARFLPAGDELVCVYTPLRPVVARMDVRTPSTRENARHYSHHHEGLVVAEALRTKKATCCGCCAAETPPRSLGAFRL